MNNNKCMSFLKVNNYICPVCKQEHETLSNYSTVVCDRCLYMYGLTTIDDESMTVGFDKNNFFYCEINGLLFRTKECFVRGIPCYINTENNKISILATVKVPNGPKTIIKK